MGLPPQELADRDENLAEHQKVANDRDEAVSADGSATGGPREHQQPEYRHQLVGPHESGHTKNKVQLHNQVEDQIFHENDFEGEQQFYYREPSGMKR